MPVNEGNRGLPPAPWAFIQVYDNLKPFLRLIFLINGFLQVYNVVIALEITEQLTHQTYKMYHTLTLVFPKAVKTFVKINRYSFMCTAKKL